MMSRRSRRRRSRRGASSLKVAIYSTILLGALVGLGATAWQMHGKPVADAYGCFDVPDQPHSFALFDGSEPRFNEVQARSLSNYAGQLYARLPFNEKLSVITTEGDQVADIPVPRFHLCGPARTSADLEGVGAGSATLQFLAKEAERRKARLYLPEVEALTAQEALPGRAQNTQSPILETLRGISKLPGFGPGARLIVISDLLQNSDSAQFCTRKGDMPRFARFAEKPVYKKLAPRSLEGVSVELLVLQRHGYGGQPLPYCASEDELMRFWSDFFTANGVADLEITRIRHGGTGG